jgi:hypothetical protein
MFPSAPSRVVTYIATYTVTYISPYSPTCQTRNRKPTANQPNKNILVFCRIPELCLCDFAESRDNIPTFLSRRAGSRKAGRMLECCLPRKKSPAVKKRQKNRSGKKKKRKIRITFQGCVL